MSEFSAGGVVVRGDEVVVIVPTRPDRNGKPVLGLPKGHPDDGESAEQAAIREVREEAGIEAEIVAKLGDVQYRYSRGGRLVSKQVTFFLMQYRSGDVADHDHEVEDARWIPLTEAAAALTYAGEREIVARALLQRASGR